LEPTNADPLAFLIGRRYSLTMDTPKLARGLYRTGSYEAGNAAAYVTDGTMAFEIDESTYRMRPYLPVFDGLPTREEYEANGGKVA